MKETKICPYCGKEIQATAKKCRYCGKWLDGSSNISQSHSVPPVISKTSIGNVNKNKKNIIFLSIILIIVVGAFLAFSLNKHDSSKMYMSDLTEKSEVVTTEGYPELGMEGESYTQSVLFDKNGKRYEGEVWEDDDMTCHICTNGVAMVIEYFYPDGKIAYDTQTFYNNDGKEVTKDAFKEIYYDKYKSKLTHPEQLLDFLNNISN